MIIDNHVRLLGAEDFKDPEIVKHLETTSALDYEDERPVLVKTGFELTQRELKFLKAVAVREDVDLNRIFRAIVKKWLEAQHYEYPIGLIADRPEDVVEMDFRPDEGEPHDYGGDLHD